MIEIKRIKKPTASDIDQWIGGLEGTDLETRSVYRLSKNGSVVWCVAIAFDAGVFKEEIVWLKAGGAAIGGGDDLYVLSLTDGAILFHHKLNGYFGQMCLSPDKVSLYVSGATDLLALTTSLETAWYKKNLAVDGIIFDKISESVLHLSTEVDPPGGWEKVTVDATNGKEIDRVSENR